MIFDFYYFFHIFSTSKNGFHCHLICSGKFDLQKAPKKPILWKNYILREKLNAKASKNELQSISYRNLTAKMSFANPKNEEVWKKFYSHSQTYIRIWHWYKIFNGTFNKLINWRQKTLSSQNCYNYAQARKQKSM